MQRNLKLWREAASIIVLAKNVTHADVWNYKILTVKRSKTMKYMPNLHTFPGGVIEKSDSEHEWLKLYESFGLGNNYFNQIPSGQRASIFKNYDDNELPRYISLRISAIREAFEECGILFCKPSQSNHEKKKHSIWATCIGGQEMKKWQHAVQKDSSQFLEMCYKLKVYPDIHSLHEWSNWLTPFTMPKQFDTIFFVAAIDQVPPTEMDLNEIQDIEWSSPGSYLKMNVEKQIMFAPPQFYEISKMYNFHYIHKLLEYASEQSNKGCDRILPYRLLAAGKNITLLPGDGLYPDKEKLQEKELTTVDTMPECKTMHRIIHKDHFLNEIIITNFTPSYILPFPYKHNKL